MFENGKHVTVQGSKSAVRNYDTCSASTVIQMLRIQGRKAKRCGSKARRLLSASAAALSIGAQNAPDENAYAPLVRHGDIRGTVQYLSLYRNHNHNAPFGRIGTLELEMRLQSRLFHRCSFNYNGETGFVSIPAARWEQSDTISALRRSAPK